jgi:ribosomal protein S18 acetylase RimI-like enzyme
MKKIFTLFTFSGLYARQLYSDDHETIQSLLKSCDDFSILVTGNPYEPTAGRDLLLSCPPGIDPGNKYVIGIFNQNDHMVGLLDAVKGYPISEVWFVGLLIFLPENRNMGFGKKVMSKFVDWVHSQGAAEIRLGVVENNQAAIQFWDKLGFKLLEIRPPVKYGLKEYKVFVYQRFIDEKHVNG